MNVMHSILYLIPNLLNTKLAIQFSTLILSIKGLMQPLTKYESERMPKRTRSKLICTLKVSNNSFPFSALSAYLSSAKWSTTGHSKEWNYMCNLVKIFKRFQLNHFDKKFSGLETIFQTETGNIVYCTGN